MAIVPVKIDRTSKPPLGTPLRADGHWATSGIVRAWSFSEGGGAKTADSVSGSLATKTATTEDPLGIAFNGTSSVITANDDAAKIPRDEGAFVVIVKRIFDDNVATEQPIFFCRYNAGNYIRLHYDDDTATPGQWELTYSRGYTTNTAISTPDAIPYGGTCVVAAVWSVSRNAMELYVDGILKAQATLSGTATWPPTSLLFGCDSAASRYYTGALGGVFLLSVSSVDYVRSFSSNPWQIYEPETVWIEVGGSGFETLASSASWSIAAAISLDTAWRIKTLIDQAGAWRIYTKGDATSSWEIAGASESPTAWKNCAKVGSDTSWKLKAAAESNTAWRILLNQLLQNQTGWSIRAEQALNTTWSIKAIIDSAAAWAVLTAMPADTAWQILTAGAYIANTSWRIKAASEQVTAWRLKTSLLSDTDWTIINGMSEATAWDILGSVAAGTGWRIHNATSSTTSWRIDSELLPEPVKIFLAPGRQLIFNAERRVLIITAPAK